MIDLKKLRNNPDEMRDNLKKRNMSIDLDRFLELDTEIIGLNISIDEIRATKNTASKEIPKLSPENKKIKLNELKELSAREDELNTRLSNITPEYESLLFRLPNYLDPDAQIWDTEDDSLVVSKYLEPTKFDFEPKSHSEIWETKWWIDSEKAAEVSGSRFYYLKWNIVFLQFAIVQYALSKLAKAGFSPVLPPVLVREHAMFGTGFLPAWEDWVYRVNEDSDDLYLVGTGEVPLTSYHSGEIIEDLSKPIQYVGYSECFRREAWSAWKDTKWILRVHQFQKVEMVCFTRPEDSKAMHNKMVLLEEEIWQSLGIPYQKINIASWDLWAPALMKYDIEAWMPGQNKYREVTSCSNVWEYQTRRLWIRYRDTDGSIKYRHSLNWTVIALSRCLIAIIENYQTIDGDVEIPEVLKPYMHWIEKI